MIATRLIALCIAVFMAIPTNALASPSDHFVTTWKTDKPGVSNATSIELPMVGGPYDVDWNNDGTFDEFGLYDRVTHDFGVADTYTIRIRGIYDSIRFGNGGDKEKILSLDQWGTNSWKSMAIAFYGARNLRVLAIDNPDFSAVTDMNSMFASARLANPDTSNWNTSAVTNMSYMFSYATSANPNTSNWDTSAVTDMSFMFESSSLANPDTSGWDTSSVTTMLGMFQFAPLANPDTLNWDTSSVTTMVAMFQYARLANPDTRNWDTSSVTDMSYMFNQANSAIPDTSGWDTSSVTDMKLMFQYTFLANPDTSGWDTANVTDMSQMFLGASSFDQDIGSWDVASLTQAKFMFLDATLSTPNYDSLLIGWSSQLLNTGVSFHGGNSTYCNPDAIAARATLIASDFWRITDGGQTCPPEDTCNVQQVGGDTANSPVSYEACEILTLGPSFTAEAGADVTLSSGWEIALLPGFSVEQGATLNANVCGQSLCLTSLNPMPYGCHSCVDQICDIDATCCTDDFDAACLDMVDTVCGLVCEAEN